MIAIIDYDTGNLKSIENMLKVAGIPAIISRDPTELAASSGLILPGVGHFDFGMRSLKRLGLVNPLCDLVLGAKKPVFGICLGVQLLTRGSDEGTEPGLGWIPAQTVTFDRSRLSAELRIPHMGWADTKFTKLSPICDRVEALPRYYYVHSFHLLADDPRDELCNTVHGYRFTAGLERGNVLGVQFHPEKSHRFGKKILANFASMCGLEAHV